MSAVALARVGLRRVEEHDTEEVAVLHVVDAYDEVEDVRAALTGSAAFAGISAAEDAKTAALDLSSLDEEGTTPNLTGMFMIGDIEALGAALDEDPVAKATRRRRSELRLVYLGLASLSALLVGFGVAVSL